MEPIFSFDDDEHQEHDSIVSKLKFVYEAIQNSSNLKLISCWTHGSSRISIPTLLEYSICKEHGYEGVVSIPISKDKDPVLSFTIF